MAIKSSVASSDAAIAKVEDAPLAIVAAVASNGAIGCNNTIPWRLPSDLRRFRTITLGKPVLMGRRTYESIGRPLPGREIIVLTSRADIVVPAGVHLAGNLKVGLEQARRIGRKLEAAEIIIAGGAELFVSLMDRTARLYLTFVDLVPKADTFFPPIDWSNWKEVRRETHSPQDGEDAAFAFVDFVRRGPAPIDRSSAQS